MLAAQQTPISKRRTEHGTTRSIDTRRHCVAPNGARKSRHDHAALPITPAELAAEAKACVAEGASMIHLHVRDDEDAHTLDVARYQDAISAIRDKVGDDIVIQVTSEAVGIYSADEQMDMVVKLQPEAVSLAIREIVPEGSEEKAASFFSEMQALNIVPQFILYSVEDLHRCDDLMRNAIIPFSNPFLALLVRLNTPPQAVRLRWEGMCVLALRIT